MRPAAFAALLLTLVLAAGGARAQAGRPFLWLEGEDAERHTFNGHGWYCCEGVRGDLLSPGEPGARPGGWLAHYARDARPATAEYAFEVAEAGRYTVWLRASAYRVRLRLRLDGGGWLAVDSDNDPREYQNLLVPPGIDIRFLAWLRAAELPLSAGPHRLVVELAGHPALAGGQDVHGGLDVVALAGGPWTPAGALRPPAGPAPPPAPDAWFPLVAADDPFSPDSVTDMSRLLHRPAGLHGPLRAAGAELEFADGTGVRFWGLNAQPAATEALQRQQARFYAKHGVNLARLHPVESLLGLMQPDPAGGARRFDPARLDRLDRWFAILKEQGIYSDWSVFYPHVVTAADGYEAALFAELPEAGGGRSSAGFVGFMPALQEAEWAYLRPLLEHVNPYTGLRYVDDPALAFLEVHNEDSVFWHFPLNGLQGGEFPRHLAELQRRWAAWLRGRYADDSALLAAWGPIGRGSRPRDSLANERLPIYGAWEMAADGPVNRPAEHRRMGDFIRFLAETQRAYFTRRGEALRALGYRGVRVTTAWQAGGPAAELANLWTDMALDAIDRHAYTGGGEGVWRILPGAVNDETHLATPGGGILARGFEQAEHKPFMLSEWSQSPPNAWKAEAAPLVAFYGLGLHGWDASLHFSGSLPRLGSGWPRLDSYVSETPHYLGQFPALALAVARGDLRPGELVAARRLAPGEAFRGEDRLSHPRAGEPDLALPPETFAMGPATLDIGLGLPPSARADTSAWQDPAQGTLRSSTGELVWHRQARVVEVRSPRTQGLVGFAGGGRYELPALSVEALNTPFVSLLVSALDDRPLIESRHILVTALARDRQTGARYSPDGRRLEELGGPPLLLEPVQAVLAFKGPAVVSAQALDVHGLPTGTQVERDGNRLQLDGRYATYYYEIRTAGAPATPSPASPSPTAPSATVTAPPARPPLYLPRLDRRADRVDSVDSVERVYGAGP
jgi:hypothetical protein